MRARAAGAVCRAWSVDWRPAPRVSGLRWVCDCLGWRFGFSIPFPLLEGVERNWPNLRVLACENFGQDRSRCFARLVCARAFGPAALARALSSCGVPPALPGCVWCSLCRPPSCCVFFRGGGGRCDELPLSGVKLHLHLCYVESQWRWCETYIVL